jgi:oligo-1,6-glucosidase
MNQQVLSKYDIMTVGEAPGITLDKALDFVDEDREELNMFFHFDLMSLDRDGDEVFWMQKERWKLTEFKKIHSNWDKVFSKKGWGSMYLSNHDFPRSVSRWANDSPEHWHNSATMLHTFLLTMRGTPYFYFGDEIGMTNAGFERIEDYKDINTINRYELLKQNNVSLKDFIENEKDAARDNARTPMQWDTSPNSGFTSSTPWIKVTENFKNGINVASQEKDENSVLNYFKKMVQVRKQNLGLVYGAYHLLLESNEQVYAYTRTLSEEKYLILLSFSELETTVEVNEVSFKLASLVISNDQADKTKSDEVFTLKPYQALVYELA